MFVTEVMDVKFTVVIVLQYVHISDHYAVHLKLIQCCMSSAEKNDETFREGSGLGDCKVSNGFSVSHLVSFLLRELPIRVNGGANLPQRGTERNSQQD